MFNEQLTYQANHPFAGFLAQSKFCRRLEDVIRKKFSVRTTIVKSKDGSAMENPIYIIKLSASHLDEVRRVKTALELFIKAIAIKILDDQGGNDLVPIFHRN